MPEFHQRVGILQTLGYVSPDGTVTLKGRAACEINSTQVRARACMHACMLHVPGTAPTSRQLALRCGAACKQLMRWRWSLCFVAARRMSCWRLSCCSAAC